MNHCNRKTRTTASVLGVLLGMAGAINHGIFEILQGNTPTPGPFIEAIGPSHRFWIHGTEGAITVIPNFLVTGIAVLVVSLAVIVWSVKYIHRRHGATVFLVLMALLTAVGGGIGHIVLVIPVWAYATRICTPLRWWKRVLSPRATAIAARLWWPLLLLTVFSWIIVMELGIFGYLPGQTDPDTILNICFAFVLLTVLLANLAFIGAIGGDLEEKRGVLPPEER